MHVIPFCSLLTPQKLTGGTILSRNKDYIVFYRGKDFLSPEVTEALLERERLAKTIQDEEEQASLRASSLVVSNVKNIEEPGTTGTLEETLEADAKWGSKLDEDHMNRMMKAAEAARHADLVKKLERKLYIVKGDLEEQHGRRHGLQQRCLVRAWRAS